MRKTTKGHGLTTSALVAILVIAVIAFIVGGLLYGFFGNGNPVGFATAFVIVYALLGLAVIAGIVAALVQRIREVRGGEQDEARKY